MKSTRNRNDNGIKLILPTNSLIITALIMAVFVLAIIGKDVPYGIGMLVLSMMGSRIKWLRKQ